MRKINESILTKLNESDDSHVSLDKLKELRECLNNVISGMEERGMAEAHCDYNMPQGCDCLSIPGKGYIVLTSDTDQDYYFEDLMESAEDDKYEVAGFDKYDELSRLHEDDLENKVQNFNEITGEWDFIGDPVDPYIAGVSVFGDEVNIGIEMWDPDIDDYVSVNAGTYNLPEFVEKLKETDFNKSSYDVYEDCRNLIDILYLAANPNWSKLTKKLYAERDRQLKEMGTDLEEGCKSKKGKRVRKIKEAEESSVGKEFDSLFDLRSYEGPWEEAVVVFTPDSFKKDYTEEERSYKVFHSAKYFNPDMIGSGLPGYCLDGKDNGVRLDWYIYKQPGFEPWKVEKIYITK